MAIDRIASLARRTRGRSDEEPMGQPFSERVLKHWMKQLTPGLLRRSFAICHDRQQAEDIVQMAFIKLAKSPPDAGEPAIASWMRTTVTNLSISSVRRKRRAWTLIDESGTARDVRAERPSAGLERGEDMSRIEAALERLDPDKRMIIVLSVINGLSYKAIAEHLGIPIGTVMSKLNRARRALMDELGASDDVQRPSDFDIDSIRDESRKAFRR
ncbi:MAG: polymerase sigma factor SigW [Planctomycetota bacterium]|jgi:RNA polymerase sigma-70 factor (ECF subfamily)